MTTLMKQKTAALVTEVWCVFYNKSVFWKSKSLKKQVKLPNVALVKRTLQ